MGVVEDLKMDFLFRDNPLTVKMKEHVKIIEETVSTFLYLFVM